MYKGKKIAVIIPALNEAQNIPEVIREIPSFADRIIVADNGSSDGTAEAARRFGAETVREERRGYGWACLKAMGALADEEIVVFLDADLADVPGEMQRLVAPVAEDTADMTVSNRFTPLMERNAMSPPQRFGNRLSVFLIRLLWGYRYRDLGPFRAVSRQALDEMRMSDGTYGWTVEMQIKAVRMGLRVTQVDVPYRVRAHGKSKVSGTVRGVVLAGAKILWIIGSFRVREIFGKL